MEEEVNVPVEEVVVEAPVEAPVETDVSTAGHDFNPEWAKPAEEAPAE